MDDWWQNYDQNMILNNAFQIVKKPKKFISKAIEKSANTFIKYNIKLVKVIKTEEKRKKVMSFQLPALLNRPKL